MSDHSFYVGFERLEDLLAARDGQLPIYLATLTERRPTDTPGFQYAQTYLLVSDVHEQICRYWKFGFARTAELGGQPMDAQLSNRVLNCAMATADEVSRLIEARYGHPPLRAGVSFPLDLRYVEGGTDLLVYNKEANRFVAR